MKEMYERYKYLVEQAKEREEEQDRLLEEEKRKENDTVARYEALKESAELKRQNNAKFIQLRKDAKDMLMTEALSHIVNAALGENAVKSLTNNLVYQFVKENEGADMIMARNVAKTYTLENLFNLIDDTCDAMLEKAKEKGKPEIEKQDLVSFLDSLDNDGDIENMTQAIALRITTGEEEFINNNISDKMTIKGIVDDTTNRINAAKQDGAIDQQVADDIAQEAARESRAKINAIHTDKPRSVFDTMVRKMSENVMKNKSLRESYSNGDNLDMNKIVNTARTMYGFLETVNSLQLVRVTESYIKEMLK